MSLDLKDYDIVHSNEGAGLLVRHPNMVETYHHYYGQSTDINSMFFDKLETLQCRRVRKIIVPSQATKKSLCSRGFSEDRVVAIHHGVDHELFRPNLDSRAFMRKKFGLADSFVVISVGRLIEHKRHLDMVRALSKVPGSTFILVGTGMEEERILSLAKEKNVRVLRFHDVSDSALADLYNVADVYAHASVLEGFGLAILEAMSCGLPIVCYEAGDLRDVVSESGFVLRQGDVEGMGENLEFLRVHEDERKALSTSALNRSKMFSWERSVEEHLEVFKKVCGKA